MKRGQQVRILRTNELATIADIELIKKNGKVHRYCHLMTDKNPDLWMDAEELGGVTEHVQITFQGENGQELLFDVEQDYRKDNMQINVTGRNPVNLKEHHGVHVVLAASFIKSLKSE